MKHKARILHTAIETRDVKRFIVERPDGFDFEPGQGVEIAIDDDDWRDEPRPFTPTSLPADPVLEFTIKAYPQHEGVTRALHALEAGAQLLIDEPFGTIEYKGPGVFIAGGAGITPFLAILRMLEQRGELDGQTLLFANSTADDVICERELRLLLGDRCHLLYSKLAPVGIGTERIDMQTIDRLVDDFDQKFYVCGPDGMMDAVKQILADHDVDPDTVVFEQ